MKKVLDVFTEGWLKDNIEKLRQELIEQGIKYKVEIQMPDGKIKWLYARDPTYVQLYCEQVGAKIVRVEDF